MKDTITIEYRTRKDCCPCCDRELDEVKISDIKEFDLSKENLLERIDWNEVAEFEDDLQESVRDYVYDTIHFFAVSSSDSILIENSEIDKVKNFILSEIKKN